MTANIANQTNTTRARSAPIVAAFDLGSNSIKMTVARRRPDDSVEEFLWRSETVRLGQGIDATNELAPDRVAAALDTLQRFATEARANGATRLLGVATEATRVTKNGPKFLALVRETTGIDIQTISGESEADLTFRGLDGVVDLDGSSVIADIGGGSTEIIVSANGQMSWARSFSIGSGRLTDRHIASDPPRLEEIEECRQEARSAFLIVPLANARGGRLVVVGGTGEYLKRLLPSSPPSTPADVDDVIQRLNTTTSADLAKELQIAEARARVLPAGVAIARAVADLMNPTAVEAAQSGIRRGLILAAWSGAI